jgi:hypothetical protein
MDHHIRISTVLALAGMLPFLSGFVFRLAEGTDNGAVDLQLILAVDISGSMDQMQLQAQRDGYVRAFANHELMRAVASGEQGRIAVLYMEWAGRGHQQVIIPWTVIEDRNSAENFSHRLAAQPLSQPLEGHRGTSISGALEFAARLFTARIGRGERRVVDISGNGSNNDGEPVARPRDALLSEGVTINGLPVLIGSGDAQLADYYRYCVIGGRGAFEIVADGTGSFEEALRHKLQHEIVAQGSAPIVATDASALAASFDCAMLGEQPGR